MMFTGVVVAVLEVTARFSSEVQGDVSKSNGLLIDWKYRFLLILWLMCLANQA